MIEDNAVSNLALARTRLANERTLLAYVRTGLTIAAAGFAMAEFLTGVVAGTVAVVLMVAGGVTVVAGFWRFRQVSLRLQR